MQFKAGYISDSIAKVITDFKATLDKHMPADQTQLDQINGLLQYVSSFDVEFSHTHNPDFKKLNPVLATLNNIITRGLPTKAPIVLEELFAEVGLTKQSKHESEINFSFLVNPIEYNYIFKLLHIIEPGLEISKENYGGHPGSKSEWLFLHEMLKDFPFSKQIFESQRDFATINRDLGGGRSVDFSYEFPYDNTTGIGPKRKGIIFEYDGIQHELTTYKYYDSYRDDAAVSEGFDTLRQASDRLEADDLIKNTFRSDIFRIFQKNYKNEINKQTLAEYSLIFIPFAVARIQKTIIEFLLVHLELFKKEKITIAIIERDLPCGAVAIKSLQDLFLNINALLEEKDKTVLPEISLTIFENAKWVIDKKQHLDASVKDEIYFDQNEFDIIIDHSILRRSNIYKETDFTKKDKAIKIRSAHYFDTAFGKTRRVYCAELLHYKTLVNKKDDGSHIPVSKYEVHINYFIQNIFRKVSFREGQLPIISRALQQKPVIGLLPTGGGKSLTFQLSAFLQPGLCLVVDPIKSLMEDQVRVLKQNWIDSCEFINSNLARKERVKKLIEFRYGETMFLFVSPERFVMKDFRNIISTIDVSLFGLAFSYCVIDEVHCVSEWGHDFRTTYLMLGKNAQKYMKTKRGNNVSLIGLTATASFDVLTDIERELSINSDEIIDAVIAIDNTIRPELFFSVVENKIRAENFPILSQDLKDKIGSAKQMQINLQIESIIEKLNSINEEVVSEYLKQHFNDFELYVDFNNPEQKKYIDKIKLGILNQKEIIDFNDVISVVFCPHTTGAFGITQDANPFPANKELFENLVIPSENKGYFMGGDDKIKKEVIENAQKYFLQFMLGKINYMVCTKAFGMGIDKEHIRSIYHINYSSSPESYIQEAGRAGRDKVKSICSIFIDRNIYYTVKNDFISKNYLKNFKLISDRKEARELGESYNKRLNRISEKYYGDITSLIEKYKEFGLELSKDNDIIEFNQDKSIHDYFHSNSFKGTKTEGFQLDRLTKYNEGINTTQIKLVQEKYNIEFNDNIKLNLHLTGGLTGWVYINSDDGMAFGRFKSNILNPVARIDGLGNNSNPDLQKSQQLLDFLIDEWINDGKIEHSLFEFFQKNVIEGLNLGQSLVEKFESTEEDRFCFQVPFYFKSNDLENRLINDFNLNRLPIIHAERSTKEFINTLINYSSHFEDFILRIEEQWDLDIITDQIYIQNKDEYKAMYYSEMNFADVSKMIYRLYSVGLIDDYTIDYNLGIFSIEVLRRDKNYYIDKTEIHLLKYLSRAVTLHKIKNLTELTSKLSVFETIKKCVNEIITFTYDDIVKKRKDAINDLFKFISDSIDFAKLKKNTFAYKDFWFNHHFKDQMYYYFNAKYARVGFKIGGKPYSLLEDTDKGRMSNWETFDKYAHVLNEQASFISECKMMMGSCRRIWRTLYKDDSKKEYILKLLYSFSTFGLNNKFYFKEAEDLFFEGFSIFFEQHNSYELLKDKMLSFEDHLLKCTSNRDYESYLNMAKHKIMLNVNLKFAKNINEQLQKAL